MFINSCFKWANLQLAVASLAFACLIVELRHHQESFTSLLLVSRIKKHCVIKNGVYVLKCKDGLLDFNTAHKFTSCFYQLSQICYLQWWNKMTVYVNLLVTSDSLLIPFKIYEQHWCVNALPTNQFLVVCLRYVLYSNLSCSELIVCINTRAELCNGALFRWLFFSVFHFIPKIWKWWLLKFIVCLQL